MQNGSLVKRLRHQPLTLKTWVRFPYESPRQDTSNEVSFLSWWLVRGISPGASAKGALRWVRIPREAVWELAHKRQAWVYSVYWNSHIRQCNTLVHLKMDTNHGVHFSILWRLVRGISPGDEVAGFAYATQSASSLHVSGKRGYIQLRWNSRTNPAFCWHQR